MYDMQAFPLQLKKTLRGAQEHCSVSCIEGQSLRYCIGLYTSVHQFWEGPHMHVMLRCLQTFGHIMYMSVHTCWI